MATKRRTKERRERIESETVEVDPDAQSSGEEPETEEVRVVRTPEEEREVEVTEHRVIVNRP